MAALDADCRAAEVCKAGRCSARLGRCMVVSPEDCSHAAGCRLSPCEVVDGACVGANTSFGERHVVADLSPGMAKAGMWMTFVGLVGAGIGGAIVGATLGGSCRSRQDYGGAIAEQACLGAGAFFLIAGGASAITGSVLWGVGSVDVERPAVRHDAWLAPRVVVGPGNLGAVWSF